MTGRIVSIPDRSTIELPSQKRWTRVKSDRVHFYRVIPTLFFNLKELP